MQTKHVLFIFPLALLLLGAGCQVKGPAARSRTNVNRPSVDVLSPLAQNPQGPAELQGIIATCYRRPALVETEDGTTTYPQASCFLDNALRLRDRRLCDFIVSEARNQAGNALRAGCESGTGIPGSTP